MTTPNSLNPQAPANGTATLTPPPVVSPMDAYAAMFDIQDNPPPIVIPPQAKPAPPAAVAAAVPAATSDTPQTPTPPAPPQPPVAGQPTPLLKHPASLVKSAIEVCGLHPLLLERLDTPELTQVVLEAMQNRLANAASASQAAALNAPAPAAAAANVAAQMPQPPQEPSWDWGEHQAFDDMGNPVAGQKMKYTDEMINPAIAHHIKHQATRIEKLEKFIDSMQRKVVASQEQKFEREFDATFSLYPEVFGKGSADEVRSNPEYMQRRQLVFGAVRGMFRGMAPELAAKMTIADGVRAMTKSFFGKDPPLAAAANGQLALPNGHPGSQFAAGNVAVPTQRTPSSLPLGEPRAREAVKQWWDENKGAGGVPSEGVTTLDEFF